MGVGTTAALVQLENTPRLLRAWFEGVPDAWLETSEGPDTYRPRDVLGHLVTGEEDDWMTRVRVILEHGDGQAFDPFDRDAFRTRYPETPVPTLLDRFEETRSRNLTALRALRIGEEDLARPGSHPNLGPVTLGHLLSAWVVHDLAHVAQIARVLAKDLADDVGPWEEYFSILGR